MNERTFDYGTQGAGALLLTYTADANACVALHLDGAERSLAQWPLQPARTPRKLLLALEQPLTELHRVALTASHATVTDWTLCPASQVVRGRNPVLPVDTPDPDIIRVDDTYYMVSTTMHFMPGAILLRSYDLISWEIVGHIYDTLPDTDGRSLRNGKNAYGQGMWAPTLRYHAGTFYVSFAANDTHCSYLYAARQVEGPWERLPMQGFYYDSSLFFDQDGRVYIVHGQRKVRLTELLPDLSAPKPDGVDRLLVDYGTAKRLGYEGSHLYRIQGDYYLFVIHSNRRKWFREVSIFHAPSLDAPFEGGVALHDDMGRTGCGVAQGGAVDTPDGRWFCFLFQDRDAAGRMPVLLPMHFDEGRAVLDPVPQTVVNLTTRPGYTYAPLCSDDLTAPCWEWNHIPRPSSVQRDAHTLRLTTDQCSASLTDAPNTLTLRAPEPGCTAEVTVDVSSMRPGDEAGLCVLQSCWASVSLYRTESGVLLRATTRRKGDADEGVVRAERPWTSSTARLRVCLDFTCDHASLWVQEPKGWRCLVRNHRMAFLLDHFTGNRIGLFAMSHAQTGGSAVFTAFHGSWVDPQQA